MPDFRSDFDDPSDMVQFGVIGGYTVFPTFKDEYWL